LSECRPSAFTPLFHKTSRASLIFFAQSCVVQAVTYLNGYARA